MLGRANAQADQFRSDAEREQERANELAARLLAVTRAAAADRGELEFARFKLVQLGETMKTLEARPWWRRMLG